MLLKSQYLSIISVMYLIVWNKLMAGLIIVVTLKLYSNGSNISQLH